LKMLAGHSARRTGSFILLKRKTVGKWEERLLPQRGRLGSHCESGAPRGDGLKGKGLAKRAYDTIRVKTVGHPAE